MLPLNQQRFVLLRQQATSKLYNSNDSSTNTHTHIYLFICCGFDTMTIKRFRVIKQKFIVSISELWCVYDLLFIQAGSEPHSPIVMSAQATNCSFISTFHHWLHFYDITAGRYLRWRNHAGITGHPLTSIYLDRRADLVHDEVCSTEIKVNYLKTFDAS